MVVMSQLPQRAPDVVFFSRKKEEGKKARGGVIHELPLLLNEKN